MEKEKCVGKDKPDILGIAIDCLAFANVQLSKADSISKSDSTYYYYLDQAARHLKIGRELIGEMEEFIHSSRL